MFGKRVYTLNRVRDSITVREGNEEIKLYVDSDSNSLMTKLLAAQKRLMSITGETSAEELKQTARALSEAMFGAQQTDQLFAFYHGDENCVVQICSMYFSDSKNGLGKKIAKTQKKSR